MDRRISKPLGGAREYMFLLYNTTTPSIAKKRISTLTYAYATAI